MGIPVHIHDEKSFQKYTRCIKVRGNLTMTQRDSYTCVHLIRRTWVGLKLMSNPAELSETKGVNEPLSNMCVGHSNNTLTI